ncbi:TetR/AcrR family transcriptional regulator [Frigidibacter oleivorans]|uniref:TetR/AcrR family transcriptional regulator n=1 Tax=Frigidibacter oleivorans TaxID=2487129 RepID=UPI000F8F3E5B|nr:TetR/AcrR family transcriptional regulator [Frigidibacter oleivorans]
MSSKDRDCPAALPGGTADAPEETPARVDGRLLRGEATRDKVLDAAERCFGRDGFDAVSIRQVAAEAGVTLGVVGFHGGSKADLFRTVLARRVNALNLLRRARLTELRSARGRLTLRGIVAAYLAPYIDYASSGDPQWQAYAALIARTTADDRNYCHVRDLYDPVAQEFIAAMAEVHPEAERETLAALLTFSVASLLAVVASRARIAGLADCAPRLPSAYRDTLIEFCTGGMERVLSQSIRVRPA